MALPVQTIANRFLEIARLEGKTIDPMKLQKLVYLAHGWSLAFTRQPLIREQFEAWKFGPICPSLYRSYKQFGAGPIPPPSNGQGALDQASEYIVNEAWRVYGERTGIELSMLTHKPGSAWDFTRRLNETPWNDAVIANALIEDEFRERQEKSID